MKRLFFILSLSFVLPLFQLTAQPTALVHTNQPFYVSGEVIWYKLYLPGNFPAGPKVITLSLFDRSGKVVDQSYLRRQEEPAIYGHYQIPFDWTSGIYRLVFSATEETAHRPILLAEAILPVYDDFGEDGNAGRKAEAGSRPGFSESSRPSDLRIEILPEQDEYPPRSTATIRVKVTNGRGDPVTAGLSVSVRDQTLYDVDHPLFATVHAGKRFLDTYALEEHITLRGTLFDTTGQSILPGGNIGAYVVGEKQFIYAKADEAARFTLDLPDVYGPSPIHIGGFLPEDLLAVLDQQVDGLMPLAGALPYPPAVVRYLEWSQKRKLIYQLYGRLEHTFTASLPADDNKIEEPDSPVALDEYKAFTDIPNMVKELLIPIRFRSRKDGTQEARVFDPTQEIRRFHSSRPLFIVDGKLTRNDDYIANLDITKIERFDLYYKLEKSLRLFGPMARYGLVMIQSRNRDIELPESDRKNFFTINGFQPRVDYPVQLPAAGDSPVRLQPSLFWAPNVQTNERGEATLTVPLPDDHSRYRVEIVAQDQEGKRGSGEAFFVIGSSNE